MTKHEDYNMSLEEMMLLFNQNKIELKKLHTDIESINIQMSEKLKNSSNFFFQVSNKQKNELLKLGKAIRELEIKEEDIRESQKQLAVKIGKKRKLGNS